jgi:hypothetical protein
LSTSLAGVCSVIVSLLLLLVFGEELSKAPARPTEDLPLPPILNPFLGLSASSSAVSLALVAIDASGGSSSKSGALVFLAVAPPIRNPPPFFGDGARASGEGVLTSGGFFAGDFFVVVLLWLWL